MRTTVQRKRTVTQSSDSGLTLAQVMENADRQLAKEREYIKKTGKCPRCKLNRVASGFTRCRPCAEELAQVMADFLAGKIL